MTEEVKKAIEDQFRDRMIYQKIKFKSKKYYQEQAAFFAGAMTAIHATIGEAPSAAWSIMLMGNREIIPQYKIN